MKYIVKQKFVDKYTAKEYQVGEIVDFKKTRAEEILAVGDFLIELEVKVAKKTEKDGVKSADVKITPKTTTKKKKSTTKKK